MTRFSTMTALLAGMSLFVSTANAATITEDFEGGGIPAGWTTIGSVSNQANGNPGNALNADAGGTNFLVNNGPAFDATQPISGSFDFYLVESGNYSNMRFMMGDILDGRDGGANEFIDVDLRERTFGARANILDGSGANIFNGSGNNQYRIDTNQWISATFTWTPTVSTIGDFSISWTYPAQPNRGPMTVNGFFFDTAAVYFGFGTVDDAGRFDNINIQGTEIPEPGSLALLGLGGLLMARRRRG